MIDDFLNVQWNFHGKLILINTHFRYYFKQSHGKFMWDFRFSVNKNVSGLVVELHMKSQGMSLCR